MLAKKGAVVQFSPRYTMHAKLVYKWLRNPCFALVVDDPAEFIETIFFIRSYRRSPNGVRLMRNPLILHLHVDLILSDRRCVLTEGQTALGNLAGLVNVLIH